MGTAATTFFDLFSGIGGFRLAMEREGFKCVGSCEIDRYARQVYRAHWEEPEFGDIRKVDARDIPSHDILCAGFPCQAFSLAGKRLGFEDTRGTLFFEIARIAREKRPRLLLLENVKGLLYHDLGRTFAVILAALDELRYDAEWQSFNSKYFVPQNRERVFIIGHSRDQPRSQTFPIRDSDQVNDSTLQTPQGEGRRVRSTYTRTIDAHFAKGGGSRTMIRVNEGSEHQSTDLFSPDGVAPALTTPSGGRHIPMIMIGDTKATRKQGLVLFSDADGDSNRIYEVGGIARTLRSNSGGYGSKTGAYRIKDMQIRKLTPLECERLQGFPDGFTDVGISDTQRYKCLGNAVTVPVVQFIARHLINGK